MFFRITPPKNSLNNVEPASVWVCLDNISRVEEVRRRPGEQNEIGLKMFEKVTDRSHFINEENTSRETIQAILDYLAKNCLNPREKTEHKKQTAA